MHVSGGVGIDQTGSYGGYWSVEGGFGGGVKLECKPCLGFSSDDMVSKDESSRKGTLGFGLGVIGVDGSVSQPIEQLPGEPIRLGPPSYSGQIGPGEAGVSGSVEIEHTRQQKWGQIFPAGAEDLFRACTSPDGYQNFREILSRYSGGVL